MKRVPVQQSRSRQRAHRQRGAALIMALLIAALATALASAMIWRENLWLRQLETRRDLAQTRVLLRAGIDWARAVLAEDARTSAYDHPGETWTTQVPAMPAEGGEISGGLSDVQARWNLNNLVRDGASSPADIAVCKRLLQQLQLPVELATALGDWLVAGQPPQPAERPAVVTNRLDVGSSAVAAATARQGGSRELGDVDNLLQIPGFTPAVVSRLRPYVSAIPGYNPVNLNSASAMVIAAVLDQFSPAEVQQFVVERQRVPYLDLNDFEKRLPRAAAARPEILTAAQRVQLDTRSRYFSVALQVRYGSAESAAVALLERNNNWPDIVWQKFE